ncbi:MAG: cytochrome c [Sulfurimonas sp.]|nr:cytochrome c [Sulfurimonas sp.]
MKFIILLFLPFFIYAKTSFITQMEYSSQLYKNPRGIGCNKCHGEDGKGKLIAKYLHKQMNKEFNGPPINSINYDDFEKALNISKRGMPRYYLTQSEIKALFFYLQEIKLNDNK